jgi:Fur family zinc uptake transcriptional regulator
MNTTQSSLTKKSQNVALTKNQKIVLNLLESSTEPLKAYSILASLQNEGLKSPLQVYRALDKLVELGKIHKIESKNSFIICNNSNCSNSSNTVFAICENCENVREIKNAQLQESIGQLAKKHRVNMNRYNLEFYELCKNCKTN